MLWPGPCVVDDGREHGDLDHAAEDVIAPLADSTNNDRDDVHDAQRDVGDSVESRVQYECGEHHQARDDDIRSGSEKE